jgi:hypothetical protein
MQPPELPAGYHINSAEQLERLQAATVAAWKALAGTVAGVALVFVMPDGTVTASLVGAAENSRALAALLTAGPETLRLTVARFLTGAGGKTTIVESD